MTRRTSFNIIPEQGEHAILIGQNGSGKTVLACFILMHIPQAPCLIYDTKIEPKFSKLPKSIIVSTMDEALTYKDDVSIDYIIIRPPVELMRDPMKLDDYLWQHYLHFHYCPAYIDEAYTFHSRGQPGQGLIALLTRGRSKGISTIVSTQRPVLVSRFCITEAKKAYVLRISDKADKKRIDDLIPNFSEMPSPVRHGFYFFEVGMDSPEMFAPISLDARFDTGYVDLGEEANTANADEVVADTGNIPSRHIWV